MKKNNEGFSLIELIIVIAIMAILSTFAFYGLHYLSMADAKGCAQDINSSVSNVKSLTMSKTKDVYMLLYRYDDNYYVKLSTNKSMTVDDKECKKVGSSDSFHIVCDGTELKNGDSRLIEITRRDGSFVTCPKRIQVNGGGEYSVWLIKNTGKHFVRTDG